MRKAAMQMPGNKQPLALLILVWQPSIEFPHVFQCH